MNRRKYFLIASVIVLFILLASPVLGATKNYLDQLCGRVNVGLIGAICELRERVVALEKRQTWDEPRIQDIERRLDELEQNKADKTFCGDEIIQSPNDAGTGGPNNDGYEQCDSNDIVYQGNAYHCSASCSISRCSVGQVRPCRVNGVQTGTQACTDEGLWGECEVE